MQGVQGRLWGRPLNQITICGTASGRARRRRTSSRAQEKIYRPSRHDGIRDGGAGDFGAGYEKGKTQKLSCEMSPSHHTAMPPHQRVLTAGELLVVLSLLTLLAATFLPVLSPAWRRDRPPTCLSHLRQREALNAMTDNVVVAFVR
ncbi:MAG: hypothetical protein RMK49_07815 [Abditibacteriales bacterium]|nr:hypothetical protein [Abditibacteriales bacterium]